jgi:predicted Zn-dependent peptidase
MRDAEQFFRTYYVPSNITVAMVGDIEAARARQLAAKYFAPIPAGIPAPLLSTREPPQRGPKQVYVESSGEPAFYVAYKRPDRYHKDDLVFDVIAVLLGGARAGWLYQELVRDKRQALSAAVQPTFPGGRYDNLFLFYITPTRGAKPEEAERALYDVLSRLQTRPVDAQALASARTRLRAGVLRQMRSNERLAAMLATAHAEYGSWKGLFQAIDGLERVTAADVARVARQYFVPSGRTVAWSLPPAPAGGRR